jgi:hypothetical protein
VPKFLGMEPKTWLWVGGGLVALIVVYYAMRAKGGGGGGAVGGDQGLGGGGISGSSPVSYAPGAPDTSGDAYQQQLNDLDIQARQEALNEQRAMFELQQEQGKQELGLWGAQQNLLFEGARKEQQIQLGYEQAQYETAQAAQDVVTRSVKGKKKVECPPGMHLVVGADGTPSCQEKGGGGFSLKTIFGGLGNIAEGLFSGAAAAAPGIGYGAANAAAGYGLGQAGLTRTGYGMPRAATPNYTPPIAPGNAPYARRGPGIDRSADYSTQHFNVPGNL